MLFFTLICHLPVYSIADKPKIDTVLLRFAVSNLTVILKNKMSTVRHSDLNPKSLNYVTLESKPVS